jgi:glycosyltransferase involved in cell wall biosynthesis
LAEEKAPDLGRDVRIRVLTVIKGLGYGGAERILTDVVANHDRAAFDCEVAYVLSDNGALAPKLRSEGTVVHDLGARSAVDLTWLVTLRRHLSRGRFDIVHFHLPYTAALGRLAAASLPHRARPAVVYTEHSLWNKASIAVRWINRAGIARDQALIVVSDAARDALPPRLKPAAEVIVHGVDVSKATDLITRRDDLRARLRAELSVHPNDVLVLTVANYRSEKGYDVLLDAAGLLDRARAPVRFAAVGHGPLETELLRRRDELGLGDRFTFLGQRDDVLNLLGGADAFVLASRQEGLPVSLMEATSVGLPVIATAVGGVPNVLTDEVDALVVPPGDPAALAAAVSRVASDETIRERLSRAARERSALFDVTVATRRIEGIYRQLLADRRRLAATSRASDCSRSSATGQS